MSKLPRGPVGIVVIPRSEVIFEPWKDQEIERGWSPLFTMHETWANDPSSMTSSPKERGSRFGGSEHKIWLDRSVRFHYLQCLPLETHVITIDIQFNRLCPHTSFV